jgi:hypothetical protein
MKLLLRVAVFVTIIAFGLIFVIASHEGPRRPSDPHGNWSLPRS